jgi:hypothetical protein
MQLTDAMRCDATAADRETDRPVEREEQGERRLVHRLQLHLLSLSCTTNKR